MNTITINEKESCKYVVNIYIYIKILFHADAATGELALWSNRSITLVGLNKIVCFLFSFFYDSLSLVSNVILYSAVDECT